MKTNKKFLMAVSALALMAAGPAMAEESRTSNQDNMPHVTKQEVKEGWKDTKEAVSETAKDVSEATSEAYNDVKTMIFDDNTSKFEETTINPNMTANGMIGQPVYNDKDERVAKIKDVILDSNGTAMMVVLADGDFTGLGKLTAFDYGVLKETTSDGKIKASLNEETIDNAAEFSYEANNSKKNVKVIPSNGYSLSNLLDAKIINAQGEAMAEVDNISIHNDGADKVIAGYNKILGLGGHHVAFAFDSMKLQEKDGNFHFQMTQNQTDELRAHQQKSSN